MRDVVKELTLERYRVKDSNPLRSTVVIPVILNDAKALAKKAGRGVLEEDIQTSAKSYLKKLETTLKAYEGLPTSGPLEKVKQEMEEVKTFLPKTLDEIGVREYLERNAISITRASELGPVLAKLPSEVNKAYASKILKEGIV